MRLAIFHSAFDAIGGAQFTAARQAKLFQALGAEVRLKTFAYDRALWNDFVGNLRVDAFPWLLEDSEEVEERRGIHARRVEWVLDDLERFDVLLAHNFPINAALGLSRHSALKLWYCHEPTRILHPRGANPNLWRRIPRILVGRSRAVRSFLAYLCWKWITSPSTRRSSRDDRIGVAGIDEIWANSEFTRDNVHRVFGTRAVEVVHPVVEFRPPKRHRDGIDRSRLAILAVSRLEQHKNLDTLLLGFSRFVEKRPAVLHIVGEGGAKRELELLRDSLGLNGLVAFHGYLPDQALDDLAASCDVFALLPVDEPFGMVFPEAASNGLLLLGPDHGGPLEILDYGKLGQAVDAFDADAVADGLERIWMMTDTEANRLRERAARACRDRFSTKVTLAKMTELLKRHGVELANAR